MAYAIIGLVLLLALAPLWHFAPSKRQRHQARLRESAALAGLFVEFRDLPLTAARLERLAANERQVLYYGMRLPPSRRNARQSHSWLRENGQWRAVKGREQAPQGLHRLPPAILAASCDERSCGLFWREEGGDAEVREMTTFLEGWREALTAS